MNDDLDAKQRFARECFRRRRHGLVLRGEWTRNFIMAFKTAGAIWDQWQREWLLPDAETMAEFSALADLPRLQAEHHQSEQLRRREQEEAHVERVETGWSKLEERWKGLTDEQRQKIEADVLRRCPYLKDKADLLHRFCLSRGAEWKA